MKNALKILELMNRTEIPVYAGEAKPLVRPYVDAMDTHGGDGLGESAFPDPAGSPAEADAVSYLSDVLLSEEQVSVIALGPLTNLARLLERSPEAFARIQELVSMGGTYKSTRELFSVAGTTTGVIRMPPQRSLKHMLPCRNCPGRTFI